MLKSRLLFIIFVFTTSLLYGDVNLTDDQIKNARSLLKEYAYIHCLKEGFNKKLNENNNTNVKNIPCMQYIFRKDLINTLHALSFTKYAVYLVEDNCKRITEKERVIYKRIEHFIKENYSNIQRQNISTSRENRATKEKTVFLKCLDLRTSKELDDLIKKQDKYITYKAVLNDNATIGNDINSTQ